MRHPVQGHAVVELSVQLNAGGRDNMSAPLPLSRRTDTELFKMARHVRSEHLFVKMHCFTLYMVMRKFGIPSMSSKLRIYGIWRDFDETCTLEDVLGN